MSDERAQDQDSAAKTHYRVKNEQGQVMYEGDDLSAATKALTAGATLEEVEGSAVPTDEPGAGYTPAFGAELASILDRAGPGSVFEKEPNGWRVRYVTPGGTVIAVGGTSISDALASHGLHRAPESHDKRKAPPDQRGVPTLVIPAATKTN